MSATTTLVLPRWVSQAFGAAIFAMPQSWPLLGEYQSSVTVSAMWNIGSATGGETDSSGRDSRRSAAPRAGRKRLRSGRGARAGDFVRSEVRIKGASLAGGSALGRDPVVAGGGPGSPAVGEGRRRDG